IKEEKPLALQISGKDNTIAYIQITAKKNGTEGKVYFTLKRSSEAFASKLTSSYFNDKYMTISGTAKQTRVIPHIEADENLELVIHTTKDAATVHQVVVRRFILPNSVLVDLNNKTFLGDSDL